MPSGADALRRKQAAKEARKQSYDSEPRQQINYFSIGDGEVITVRFLEQGDELCFADTHRIPVEGANWPVDFVCLDTNEDGTPCPACQHDHDDIRKKSTKGFINLIWRDGPVYELDERGRPRRGVNRKPIVVGQADGVFLWKCSWTVLQLLLEKDGTFKGLSSRDFKVKRRGSTMQDTTYFVDPADPDAGAQPMLLPDLKLAGEKYDVRALTTPKSYADLAQIVNSGETPDGPKKTFDRTAAAGGDPQVRASAFTR